MKILQAGNSNFGYVMAKELRKKGIETDLLISRQIISGDAVINDPLSYDKDLDDYPEWVHFGDINKRTELFSIAKFMKSYDLIHAYNAVPIHAMFSGKPYVAQSGGDDLRVKAFERSITGYLLKRAYKKANQFVYVWPIHKKYAEKLNIKDALYLPRMWDTSYFSQATRKFNTSNNLRIFLPTVEEWKTKGNDKFLRAFVRLAKEYPKVFLYYVDWGSDTEKAKSLLSEVRNNVEIIPGPISREKMTTFMEKSDVVVDQFNSGSFTRFAIEAFSFGSALLCNIDEDLHKELHGESPPVINAKNEEEILEQLRKLAYSKDTTKTIGDDAKKWWSSNFDHEKNIKKYIEIYEKILKN